MKFRVIRSHIGDKQYSVGDMREANEIEVRHLVGKCLEKMAEPLKNKSAKLAHNKAEK